MSRLSIKHGLLFALGFCSREAVAIWPRITLSLLGGGVALYVSLDLFLLELGRYVVQPSDRTASLALGIAAAGLLTMLFLHSVTTSTVVSLALGRADRGWKYFCVSRRTWRIYAAYMRFLLICIAFTAAIETLRSLIGRFADGIGASFAAKFVLLVGLATLVVRIGFLIAPVAAATDDGPIVRRSWKISLGSSGRIATTMLCVLLPGFGIEAGCEYLIRLAHLSPSITYGGTMSEFVASYRAALPAVLAAVAVAYSLTVVLLVAASAFVYRRLSAHLS